MPYYTGTQIQLPEKKRGRCIVLELLTLEEISILNEQLSIMQQLEKYGLFIYETWECPYCHGNIYVEDDVTINKHKCVRLQSGAYLSPTETTSGKRYSAKWFMEFSDIQELANKYLEQRHKTEEENKKLWANANR